MTGHLATFAENLITKIMASVKVKFKQSTVPGNKGTIYYQIIHKRKTKLLFSDYHIYTDEWDADSSKATSTLSDERLPLISAINKAILRDRSRLNDVIDYLIKNCSTFTVEQILEIYTEKYKTQSFFNYMNSLIVSLRLKGKTGTSETYTNTLKSFRTFRRNEDFPICDLNSDLIEEYETYLKCRHLSPNTISFYMRVLRAVYNRAVEENLAEAVNPFRHVYTGISKTKKRALSIYQLRKLKNIDLSYCASMNYARDMFLLSFYLRGMSLVDMAFLKKSDLKNGYITYRRRKTGQLLIIKWTKEMQSILNKYKSQSEKYLLPILKDKMINERTTYRTVGYNINFNLKKIASLLNISIPLTLYVARHSWASIAKIKGIPVNVISEGMGHDSEITTRIYLASLDISLLDKANSIVINAL